MKALALFVLSSAMVGASSQPLYNISFETPDQATNKVVKTGLAPGHVSNIEFGNPMVVSAFGPLTHQPLLFNSNGQTPYGSYYYTQVGLSFSNIMPQILDLSFDFVDTGTQHEFSVLIDTPQVRRFDFYNGQISYLNPVSRTNVGNFTTGLAYNFDIQLSYPSKTWSFYENGNFLSQGYFDPPGSLQGIRFNYSAAGPNISGTAIDNLLVAVPEPSFLPWLSGLVLIMVFRLLGARSIRLVS